jgi:predicted nucleic acid-binding protein
MTGYVIDASVAFEYLLRTPLGRTVASTIERASLVAPELMDAEVLSVLRKTVLQGRLDEERARMVVDDLIRWPVARVRHRELAQRAWYHHQNVTAYDALYVACASLYGIPLLTADSRLARVSGLGVVMHDVRMA